MQQLVTEVAEEVQSKYYGKYRGCVVDNADPDGLGRLRLSVPSLLGQAETRWALPCLPLAGETDVGLFLIPDPGAQVWVEFEEGDISQPIWVGGFWRPGEREQEAALGKPEKRVLKTPGGHVLEFDDTADGERARVRHPSGAELTIDERGSITVADAQGARLLLDADGNELSAEDANGNALVMKGEGTSIDDANGNRVQMGAAGVTVKAQQVVVDAAQVSLGGQGGEPVIKGQSFLTAYMTHTHPTAMGPSGPPIPTSELQSLSVKVRSS